MSKKKNGRYSGQRNFKQKMRKKLPIVTTHKKNTIISCPFCEKPHPITMVPNEICGTHLEFSAVQPVYSGKKVVCFKCQKGGGTLISHGGAYMHDHDCNPGVKVLTEVPKGSRNAAFIHNLPDGLRSRIERLTGKTASILEIDQKGQETGNILGYYFEKTLTE